MTTVQITLPDDLAQEARSAGLLSAEAMESMLREQLRRRAAQALQESWRGQHAEDVTEEELDQLADDVRQLRSDQRKRQAS